MRGDREFSVSGPMAKVYWALCSRNLTGATKREPFGLLRAEEPFDLGLIGFRVGCVGLMGLMGFRGVREGF